MSAHWYLPIDTNPSYVGVNENCLPPDATVYLNEKNEVIAVSVGHDTEWTEIYFLGYDNSLKEQRCDISIIRFSVLLDTNVTEGTVPLREWNKAEMIKIIDHLLSLPVCDNAEDQTIAQQYKWAIEQAKKFIIDYQLD